jgi:hypothetical protein
MTEKSEAGVGRGRCMVPIVPQEQPLVFYDQSMTNVADLEPGADPGSIAAEFV